MLLGEVPVIVTLNCIVQREVEVGPGWKSEVGLENKLPIQLLASVLAGMGISPAVLRDAGREIGSLVVNLGIKELSQCRCVAGVLRPAGHGAMGVVGL